jgi:hypothetical protein
VIERSREKPKRTNHRTSSWPILLRFNRPQSKGLIRDEAIARKAELNATLFQRPERPLLILFATLIAPEISAFSTTVQGA